jgi:hypothetical protein
MSGLSGGFADWKLASDNSSGPLTGSRYLNFVSAKSERRTMIGIISAPLRRAWLSNTGSSLLRMYFDARKAWLTSKTPASEALPRGVGQYLDRASFFQVGYKGLNRPENKGGKKPKFCRGPRFRSESQRDFAAAMRLLIAVHKEPLLRAI